MPDPTAMSRSHSDPAAPEAHTTSDHKSSVSTSSSVEGNGYEPLTPGYMSSTPGSPAVLSRNSSSYFTKEMREILDETPSDKLTFFDIFDNLAVPTRLEKWQLAINLQKERVQKLRSQGTSAKDKAVAEWRKRVPTAEEQLARYRRRVKRSLDGVNKRWTETVTINTREKISFISAVLNIFISGYLLGAAPEKYYWWFTVQLVYFMPIRFYTYHRRGMHYFLADLCYFVNALCLLSIWAFPQSKRLFISTYCLSYGNNAVAIVMWRNSLVFHSLDKVTSLFIHLIPPVMLHCLVHLTPSYQLAERFPAVFNIKFSQPTSPEHYSLWAMLGWATLPYAVWQLSYHFLITVRRREQIQAGRPTSFTWLRKSYAKTWIGRFVLSLPEALQEPAFMMIQYCYALLTILPCPLWFWYRWASASFLMFCFCWSIWNGANYYMDVFGKKFQKELEQMKQEMARMHGSPGTLTPIATPHDENLKDVGKDSDGGIDNIPLLDNPEKPKDNDTSHATNSTGKPDKESVEQSYGIMESVEKKLGST